MGTTYSIDDFMTVILDNAQILWAQGQGYMRPEIVNMYDSYLFFASASYRMSKNEHLLGVLRRKRLNRLRVAKNERSTRGNKRQRGEAVTNTASYYDLGASMDDLMHPMVYSQGTS